VFIGGPAVSGGWREDRIARLTDLITDVGDWASHGASLPFVAGAQRRMAVARLRLRSALSSTGESLPACGRLLNVDWSKLSEADALSEVAAALDEVAELLIRVRAGGANDPDRLVCLRDGAKRDCGTRLATAPARSDRPFASLGEGNLCTCSRRRRGEAARGLASTQPAPC
jgi:hypothetical protein